MGGVGGGGLRGGGGIALACRGEVVVRERRKVWRKVVEGMGGGGIVES